jgi:pimeloyl-ACP methyl ester carboxylesterase
MFRAILTFVILLACATAAQAQRATHQSVGFDTWARCTSLQGASIPARVIGLPTGGATVTQASLAPAGAPNPFGEYCLVKGEIMPVDPRAPKIHFNVAMPSHWNRKLLQVGGGGFDGHVESALELDTPVAAPPAPVARGYVTFGSDSGHQGNHFDASFALNPDSLRNFVHEQLKKTHDAVAYLVKLRYERPALHTYFIGGSEGGREAFAVIQHYPEDYDGVVAMCPAIGLVATGLKMQLITRAMQANNSAGALTQPKADLVRRAELEACDAQDGLADGIISHTHSCQIDFQRLRCPEGRDTADTCLSDAQLQTLTAMHSSTPLPYMLAEGETTLPGYAIGADWGSAAYTGKPTERISQLSDSLVRYVLSGHPQADPLAFDPLQPADSLEHVQEAARLIDTTSLDIDRFIRRGGKWILFHGEADPIIPVQSSINYYQRLLARYGRARTDQFLRFYLIPGFGHGRGISFNADNGPELNALEDWVEQGIAPGTLTLVDANPDAHARSRPMCVYPGWPQYNGQGDPNLASSFSCVVDR